jgi:hypothetical protein
MTPADLRTLIRTVPDFPAPGIMFRDITTLIGHARDLPRASAILPGAPPLRAQSWWREWRRAASFSARR